MGMDERYRGAHTEVDVVIVGAGGAGLSAAVAAAEMGARVVVLEKRRAIGGNSAFAEGIFGAESPVQRRNGIDIRNDDMFRLAMNYAHWSLNGRVVRAFIDKSGDTVRWLEEKGVQFNSVPPFSSRQLHRVFHNPDQGGPAIIRALIKECGRRDVRILCDTAVEQILVNEDGVVRGVTAAMHGTRLDVSARSVIVATGGFAGNKELLRKYCDVYTDDFFLPGLPHQGDGLKMTTGAGAATEGLGRVQMSGPNFPGNIPSLAELAREPGPIWVNRRGKRFVDEATCFNDFEAANAIMREPDKSCFVLLDDRMVKTIMKEGFVRVYQGSLRPSGAHPVPHLEKDLQMAAEGLMPVAEITPDLCNGCSVCVDVCPAAAIRLDTSPSTGQGSSPCRSACPAGVEVRRYVHLLRNGFLDEARDVLRESLPLPAITGRVCPHFCEGECARNNVDQPVNINALERFIADSESRRKSVPVERKHPEAIAVVGSGPAGLSCAYFLARAGYAVTIFEAQEMPGGMLRTGIPEYRLPREVIDEQIRYVTDMGVELKTGIRVGRDLSFASLLIDYKAIFFAGGAPLSKKIDLEGSGLRGVEWGIDFLGRLNLDHTIKLEGKVVVIGGGNVAVDVALSALRSGAREACLACLECGDEMPAYKEEIRHAVCEGVKVHEGWGPRRILGKDGKVNAIEFVRCTAITDADGCFNPSFDDREMLTLDADLVVLAIGQTVDPALLPAGIKTDGDRTIAIDPLTLETAFVGLFAGGDVTGGKPSVVKAIADGRRAAESIQRYVKGEDLRAGREGQDTSMKNPPGEQMTPMPRMETPRRRIGRIAGDFAEETTGFDEVMAKMESERCMTCGSRPVVTIEDCKMCKSCEVNCPTRAISPLRRRRSVPLAMISHHLDEIARWIGADPQVLATTVREYNEFCERGMDPVFAKERTYLHTICTRPYYALRCNVVFLTTIGGVRINEHMEAVDGNDGAIPGLFVAGNDTGGWECPTYNVLLPGSTFGFAINSGRIAGETAVRYAERRDEYGRK